MAPAHPHATSVAVYPALFYFFLVNYQIITKYVIVLKVIIVIIVVIVMIVTIVKYLVISPANKTPTWKMEFILSIFPVLQLLPTAFAGSNKTKAAHNKISSHPFYTRSSCSTNFLVWMFFHFFTLRTRVIFCVSGHR